MQSAANQVVTIDGKRVLYLRKKMIELDRCPVLYDKPFIVVSTVPMMVLYLFVQSFFKTGLMVGSLKG